MVKASWGTKRTCTCSARFYDLNKKEIECPSCGETINVEALSISTIENNLRKKPQMQVIEETKPKVKEKDVAKTTDVEADQDQDIDQKIAVEEIIGEKIKKDEKKTE